MATALIVPGLGGSGPDHWQTWWQDRDPAARRVKQADWDTPDLDRWAGQVRAALDAERAPAWLVAHSFGCLATARAARDRPGRVAGALLVAPADPDKFGVAAALPQGRLDFPSILVASSNDPWMRFERAAYWAQRWGSRLVMLGAAGHINAEAGFGPWPRGPALLAELQKRVAARCRTGRRQDMPFLEPELSS